MASRRMVSMSNNTSSLSQMCQQMDAVAKASGFQVFRLQVFNEIQEKILWNLE
jgi:hypothetical protein